jgi:hypothetical protein
VFCFSCFFFTANIITQSEKSENNLEEAAATMEELNVSQKNGNLYNTHTQKEKEKERKNN